MEDEAGQEIPAGRRHIIERPRLTRLLDETSAKVIMLVAPAGYGKTTLARQWLADKPHAWYQGGASSADVAALALGIADASEPVVSDAGRRLREWLPTSREPEQEIGIIEQFLAQDLANWPEDAWFAIDDYHLLSSEASEELVHRLLVSPGRRLLLTSRHRPAWSSARELLYGNFFELGQSSLAMTTEEANAVLATRNLGAAHGLVALADGWPAVIGLAALTPNPIQLEEGFPEELHDYFAEELFASLPPSTQEGVCRLALIPVVTRAAAEVLLGEAAEEVMDDAKAAGMFALQRAQEPTLHPLLRTFLVQKLSETEQTNLDDVVFRSVELLSETGRWAEAFALITDFDRPDLLDILLREAILPLIREGRVATLREWIDFGRVDGLTSSLLDFADAELSFREGLLDKALTLAKEAAESLDGNEPLASAAYYRAGQTSYLLDETTSALELFRKSHETATTSLAARDALWGTFMVSLELERPDVVESLSAFARVGPQDRDTRVRVANGELIIAIRTGELTDAVAAALPISDLVEGAGDPIVRSSFWHIYAVALTLHGSYEEALRAIDRAFHEVDSFKLEFARPHILVSSAAANIGLQRFAAADRALKEVEELAIGRRDDYVLTNAKAVRCRLFLQRGLPDHALYVISQEWSRAPSRCMQAEFFITKAACLARLGRIDAALTLAEKAGALSRYLEPQLLTSWVRTLCRELDSGEARADVRAAFDRSFEAGAMDTFVFAYRLEPRILDVLAADEQLKPAMGSVLVKANDIRRARSIGLAIAPEPMVALSGLTRREDEVFGLLAEGRTNREIAQALFISEVTAKVHVRNVFRKLGVRNRTEAALIAARVQHDAPHEDD